MCTYTYIYIHVYIYVCIYTYVSVHIYIHVYIHIHAKVLNSCLHTCILHVCIFLRMYGFIYEDIHQWAIYVCMPVSMYLSPNYIHACDMFFRMSTAGHGVHARVHQMQCFRFILTCEAALCVCVCVCVNICIFICTHIYTPRYPADHAHTHAYVSSDHHSLYNFVSPPRVPQLSVQFL